MPVSETVFMFSGQGSQYFQMGRTLYDDNDIFREWMIRLDGIVQQSSGRSVIETLYSDTHGKGDPFDRTLLTHPAIFMVEYSLAQSLIHAGVWPDLVLGVSLGAFAAATVAGFIGVEDALTAVMQQAIAFEECSEPGGMTAILADPALFAEDFLKGRSELAAVNFSSHFVVSARRTELAEIEAALRVHNVGYQRLPVSFPFHSQWIDKAKAPFESFMRSIRRKQGRLPLVCCDQMAILSDISDDYFWNVVRRPIRFRETTARLEQQGARRYIDVGPAGTLATFLKYGMPATTKSMVHAILTPYGSDQKSLATLLASVRH
ncbi:MAG TPA: acyltransferase domain-containing protein [Terriglobales bacterium]|nr:acyltransferase domain-containing protein [Terriglobales bacterium]